MLFSSLPDDKLTPTIAGRALETALTKSTSFLTAKLFSLRGIGSQKEAKVVDNVQVGLWSRASPRPVLSSTSNFSDFVIEETQSSSHLEASINLEKLGLLPNASCARSVLTCSPNIRPVDEEIMGTKTQPQQPRMGLRLPVVIAGGHFEERSEHNEPTKRQISLPTKQSLFSNRTAIQLAGLDAKIVSLFPKAQGAPYFDRPAKQGPRTAESSPNLPMGITRSLRRAEAQNSCLNSPSVGDLISPPCNFGDQTLCTIKNKVPEALSHLGVSADCQPTTYKSTSWPPVCTTALSSKSLTSTTSHKRSSDPSNQKAEFIGFAFPDPTIQAPFAFLSRLAEMANYENETVRIEKSSARQGEVNHKKIFRVPII